MQPIIHQAILEVLDLNLSDVAISPGDIAELRADENGYVVVYVTRQSRLPFGWGKSSYLRAGVLGFEDGNLILPALKCKAHLRVRIVQVEVAHLNFKGINSLSISVWGNPDDLAPASLKSRFFKDRRIIGPMKSNEFPN